MKSEGYNLDYLNLDYNVSEGEKKIQDIFARLNVLNVEDSIFDLKTILDYYDGIYNDFDKEKQARKIFDEYMRKVLVKANKLEKINKGLYRKLDAIKYSYDLTDQDVKVIEVIKSELIGIKKDYNEIVDAHRSKSFAYTRLGKEMEHLNNRLSATEEKLDMTLRSLGSLEEDESRAHEQLDEIKVILCKAREKINSYKLPIVNELVLGDRQEYIIERHEDEDSSIVYFKGAIIEDEQIKLPVLKPEINFKIKLYEALRKNNIIVSVVGNNEVVDSNQQAMASAIFTLNNNTTL